MNREKENREPTAPRDVLIPLGVGLVLGIAVFVMQGGFSAKDAETFWHALCDAMAVPGLLLTCVGLLSVVSGQGAFDALGFSTRKALGQILSEERRNAMPKTYYDYVTRKRERQKTKPHTVLYTGLVFLALAVGSLVIYLSVS